MSKPTMLLTKAGFYKKIWPKRAPDRQKALDSIRLEYIAGDGTLAALAERHGLDPKYVQGVCADEKWSVRKERMLELATQKVAERIVTEIVEKRITHFNDVNGLVAEGFVQAKAFLKEELAPKEFQSVVKAIVDLASCQRKNLGLDAGKAGDDDPKRIMGQLLDNVERFRKGALQLEDAIDIVPEEEKDHIVDANKMVGAEEPTPNPQPQ